MSEASAASRSPLAELLDIMARLRDPVSGSPWEREQTSASIAPHTLEEAYEVMDAVARQDMKDLKSELGDLLLHVIFHSQIAADNGHFSFDDVAQTLLDKIRRRLPNFFSGQKVSVEQQLQDWERVKMAERASRGHTSILDDVPVALPALVRNQKLQERAAQAGFRWDDLSQALAKVEEECGEVRQAVLAGDDKAHIADEIGDALMALVNLARMQGIDAEAAVRGASSKFEQRFRHVEKRLAEQGRPLQSAPLEDMLAFWNEAKSRKTA